VLDKDFKEKWVAALRSGEYQQAHGTLFNGTGYCCLGVACIVLGAKFVESTDSIQFGTGSLKWRPMLDGVDIGRLSESILVKEVADKVGLTYDNQYKLWHMNDRDRLSLSQIADYIEPAL
jgi:hypothetical protein